MEGNIPAEGNAPQNAETVETPATATATAVAEPASTPVEPSKDAPAKPDIETLLQDPEYRKELLKHPEIARELEHRLSSERGRIKADYDRREQERQQQQERQKARAELDHLETMDDYDAGVKAKQEAAAKKQELDKQEAEEALQARLQPLHDDLQVNLLRRTGQEVYGTVYELAKEAGASDEELTQLNPHNYGSLGEYVKGAIKFMATREGKNLAKDMAKVEAKAMLEEQAAAARDNTPAPEILPPSEPGMSDSEFAAAYAAGTNTNTARQLKWMRDNGIPV